MNENLNRLKALLKSWKEIGFFSLIYSNLLTIL